MRAGSILNDVPNGWARSVTEMVTNRLNSATLTQFACAADTDLIVCMRVCMCVRICARVRRGTYLCACACVASGQTCR